MSISFKRVSSSGVTVGDRATVDVDGRALVAPSMGSGGHFAVSVNLGASAVTFLAQPCKQITIANDTGTTIEVFQAGGAVFLPVFDGSYYTFFGLSDASQLGVRRKDQSATAVTVKARWEL